MRTRKQQGFIHNMVIAALVLMGVMTVGYGYLSDRNQRGLSIAESVRIAREQITLIRDALTTCYITWPAGNNGTANHPVYPLTPSVTEYGSINDLVCPGAAANLWTAINYPAPVAPPYMVQWQYKNTATGIFIKLEASTLDGNAVVAQVEKRIPADDKTVQADSIVIRLLQ